MKPVVLVPLFLAVVATAAASLYFAQRRPKPSPVSANAIVDLAADAQRDITRAPMHFTRMSDDEEIAMGRRLSEQYAQLKTALNPKQRALQQYVQQVGGKLASHAHRPLPYEFHLIPDTNVLNAFSLPGGGIYIGEGMTDLFMTEDELAAVLAHELEHIDHYHCAERFQLEVKLRHLNLDALSDLLQLPLDLWEAGYQKDEELEADREGMFLAVEAGYSPYGAVHLFETLGKLQQEYVVHAETPEQELSQLALESLGGYFRSHPAPAERLEQTQRVIADQHWQQRTAQKPFGLAYEVPN
jgi:predicted Zn-dependent protease